MFPRDSGSCQIITSGEYGVVKSKTATQVNNLIGYDSFGENSTDFFLAGNDRNRGVAGVPLLTSISKTRQKRRLADANKLNGYSADHTCLQATGAKLSEFQK